MLPILRTKQAQLDLIDIWSYIAEDSISAADKFLFTLDNQVKSIATAPKMGRLRHELADKLRSFPVGNYIIFYKIQDKELILIRVLHAARDIDTLPNIKKQ